MAPTAEQSIDELREESERTREALASTVVELRETVGDTASELKTLVSPAHIKQEFNEYVRERRESLVKTVQRQARENPLQLAAVGAAIAYPASRLLRAIPTPLLLIGAGLFLTSKRGQESTKDLRAKIEDVVQQGTERVTDVTKGVQSELEDRLAGARYRAEELGNTLSATASSVVNKGRAKFHDATDAVRNAAGSVAESAAGAADQAGATASNAAEGVQQRTAAIGPSSRESVVSFVKDNALLVAGIGAAVGALIAASIPASEAESRLFGAGSEKLKNKAREVAAQGIERAGGIAAQAAGSVAAAAAREGLDATGVSQALNGVAESVRAVADRGISTAMGSSSEPKSQSATERNPS